MYYGVQATKTFEKLKGLIRQVLSKVHGLVKDAVKIIGFKTYQERYCESAGRDPLVCPHCGQEMGVWKIWHPQYGWCMTNSMRSEGGDMRRREEVSPVRADLDEPFGPPPIEYLYRCAVCGTELWVNEAIIDVGIGMAKFKNEYYPGFMPTVGCPG
jgi:hypothetical protein